jgi:Arc/MetJ-type ribon-helix-helix transcriptional regulator
MVAFDVSLPQQQKAKYTTVSIPVTLHARVEKLIAKKTGFKSVSDYVTYVLREVVAMHEIKEVPEPFTSQDISEIKERLTALGYL